MNKKRIYSLNSMISIIYILFVAIIMILSLVYSRLTTTEEIKRITNVNMEQNFNSKHEVLDRMFSELFEQLVLLNNNPNLIEVINDQSESLNQVVSMNYNIKNLYYRFQDILSSIYINVNNQEFYFNAGEITNDLSAINYDYFFKQSIEKKQDYFWLDMKKSPFSNQNSPAISMCKVIGDMKSEVSGVIVFNIRYSYIEQLLHDNFVTTNGTVFLLSEDEHSYPLTDNQFIKKVNYKKGHSEQKIAGEKYQILCKSFNLNNWKLISLIPSSDLQKSNSKYVKLAISLFFSLFILGTIMMFIMTKYVSNPIKKFSDKLKKTSITKDKSASAVRGSGFKELDVLYESFNLMISKNENLIKKNEISLEERNRLEIELLQSQINPHFLYNTLYSIQALNDMNMNSDAATMTRALAEFYRIGLNQGDIIITLADEMDHVEGYLKIMGYRYGEKFRYTIKIENQRLLDNRIPTISLQPIVENAIYHGFKENPNKGLLEIEVRESLNGVLIFIRDDGLGISEDKLITINEEINRYELSKNKITGIGLRSVNLRIKKYFGDEFGVWLESQEKGACVKIIIPKEYQ